MLKLSDPVSSISPEFQVSSAKCRDAADEFRQRAHYDAMVDAAEDRASAAEFLGHANRLVDTILGPSAREPAAPRFVRVAPVRFGRVRLFLAKFVGRAAWRNGVNL